MGIITQHNCSVKDQNTIRPFAQQGKYTTIHNFVFDHIMPNVSPAEWKILCFIIRKTVGWHKEEDKLSLSQIKDGTGIKSRTTISKVISKLEEAKYIIVYRPDDQETPNTYSLNYDYEVVQKSYQVSDKPAEASPKNGLPLVQKMDIQKKGVKETNSIADKSASEQKEQKKKPKEPGPKTQLMDYFLKITFLIVPKNKKTSGYWWSQIGVILELVEGDVELGKQMIDQAVRNQRRDNLSICNPGSLVNVISGLMGEHRRSKAKQTDNGQYVEVKLEETNGKRKMAVSEDWLTEQLDQARGGAE